MRRRSPAVSSAGRVRSVSPYGRTRPGLHSSEATHARLAHRVRSPLVALLTISAFASPPSAQRAIPRGIAGRHMGAETWLTLPAGSAAAFGNARLHQRGWYRRHRRTQADGKVLAIRVLADADRERMVTGTPEYSAVKFRQNRSVKQLAGAADPRRSDVRRRDAPGHREGRQVDDHHLPATGRRRAERGRLPEAMRGPAAGS